MSAPGRPASLGVVAVAGATGLVGRCLVQQLCADPAVTTVHALARRPLDVAHPKLVMHVVDFTALPALPDRARNAFGIIAERVERSLFALIPLGREDWQAARTAYADFAIRELEGGLA